jgi:predicted MFS family arabinose efflux permease
MAGPQTQAALEPTGLRSLPMVAAVACLALLATAYVTNAMDRSIFPTLLPQIRQHYGYGLKSGGFLATVFNLGIAFTGIPAGYLIDRWTRKNVLLSGMAIYSLFTLVTVYATGMYDMMAYRFLTGVGEAMQIAGLYVAAGSFFYRNRAFVVGCVNIGFGLGGVLGPYLGTRITLASGSWKPAFVVFCFLGLFMAGLVWLLIPKEFTEQKSVSQLGSIDKSLVANVPQRLWNRNTLLIAVTNVMLGTIQNGYSGLYPTFARTHLHFSPMQAGTAFSFFGFGCMFGWLGGFIGDRAGTRKYIVVSYLSLAASTYLLYQVATLPWQHNVLSFLMAYFVSSSLHPNTLALIQKSVRPDRTGGATGIFTSLHFLGSGLAGYWFGMMVDSFGWLKAGLVQETVLPLLACAVILAIDPKTQWQTPRGAGH